MWTLIIGSTDMLGQPMQLTLEFGTLEEATKQIEVFQEHGVDDGYIFTLEAIK